MTAITTVASVIESMNVRVQMMGWGRDSDDHNGIRDGSTN